jgi:putative mRNA 3-end processing factor
MGSSLIKVTTEGLYCPEGEFYIDPWKPVASALITHAHSDHAVWGCEKYLAAAAGEAVLRARLGNEINLSTLGYGEQIDVRGVRLSLHPAGHVLGSSQIRLERGGEIAVVTGDYKLAGDPTCDPFEHVRCHHMVTESTFGMPIFRWQDSTLLMNDINAWWRENREEGRASILYAYSLGKAQRILSQLDASLSPIVVHGAVHRMNTAYRESGVELPATSLVEEYPPKHRFAGALVIAPPSAQNTSWTRRFEPASEAVASGWMAIRGIRRRRSVDRGFVVSDHADWPGLMQAVEASGTQSVSVTHGYTETFARWLGEKGIAADVIATRFSGESDETAVEAAS